MAFRGWAAQAGLGWILSGLFLLAPKLFVVLIAAFGKFLARSSISAADEVVSEVTLAVETALDLPSAPEKALTADSGVPRWMVLFAGFVVARMQR